MKRRSLVVFAAGVAIPTAAVGIASATSPSAVTPVAQGRRTLDEMAALLGDLHDAFPRVRAHARTPHAGTRPEEP